MYKFKKPATKEDKTAVFGPAGPFRADGSTAEYWAASQYVGTAGQGAGYLKPTSVPNASGALSGGENGNGGWTSLTYKEDFTGKNFTVEYSILNSYSWWALGISERPDEFPISFDYDADSNPHSDTGVLVSVSGGGEFVVAGAVEQSGSGRWGEGLVTTTNFGNFTGSRAVTGRFRDGYEKKEDGTNDTSKPLYASAAWDDAAKALTVVVEVRDGYLRVSLKGENRANGAERQTTTQHLILPLTEQYKGGYISLYSCQKAHGAFTHFAVREDKQEYDDGFYLSPYDYIVAERELPALFDTYVYRAPNAATSTAADVGPTDFKTLAPDSWQSGSPYWYTGYYGSSHQGLLKPTASRGYTVMTYKKARYTDFTAEVSLPGTASRFGMLFGAEAGQFPVSFDGNPGNDSGVLLSLNKDGVLHIVGAVNAATVETAATVKTSSESAYRGATDIRVQLTGGDTLAVPTTAAMNTPVFTLVAEVINGRLRVWEKAHRQLAVTVDLLDQYVGGYVSLFGVDQNGSVRSFGVRREENPAGSSAVTTTGNGNTVTSEVTFAPAEGYQLKAGSVLAYDASGSRYVPRRRDFRSGGSGLAYLMQSDSDTPIGFSAQYIRPTKQQPNMGNIGTSVNLSKKGLRFISRIVRRVTADGRVQMLLDGDWMTITDYGMIMAVQSVTAGKPLTLELTQTNKKVKKISIAERQVFFDTCDDYVDMSVCITNIEDVQDGVHMEIAARAYAVCEDGTVLYADAFRQTYAEASDLNAESAGDLVKDGKLLPLGRAAMQSNDFAMDWVNSGFEISGELAGEVKAQFNSRRTGSLLNVSIDDGAAQLLTVPTGETTVTLASGLPQGAHTVRVVSGTSAQYGTLSMLSLTYNGTLDAVRRDPAKIRIEVIGDSISCGYGMDMTKDSPGSTVIPSSNSYYTYAAVAARSLDADLSVVAHCGMTIPQVHALFPKASERSGAPAWDFANNRADVVVINLGTNDEWQGETKTQYNAANTLSNAKALLRDVRAAYPDAYIIWVYGMMRKTYEAQYQQAIDEMNDPKAMYVDFTAYKGTGGYDGNHPQRANHQAAGEKLAQYIRESCADLFGHTTKTETVQKLQSDGHVLFSGRTTAEGTGRKMSYGNTGIVLEGYLFGEVKLDIALEKYTCVLNVVVDGDVEHAGSIWVDPEVPQVTLLENLPRGSHRIEITRGVNLLTPLTMKSVTCTGTLTAPTEKTLQFEFLGDSITAGEGMLGTFASGDYVGICKSENGLYGYAAQTARAFDAALTVVTQSGNTTAQTRALFNDAAWRAAHPDDRRDLVVVNLGTNDQWKLIGSDEAGKQAVLDNITGLIDDIRAAYGQNTYIVWAYGSMTNNGFDLIKKTVEDKAAADSDSRLFFCDFYQVVNTGGANNHPNQKGNDDMARVLTQFIREHCPGIAGNGRSVAG